VYRADELRKFMTPGWFQVDFGGYAGSGSPAYEQPVHDRLAKRLLGLAGLVKSRLPANANYMIATKR